MLKVWYRTLLISIAILVVIGLFLPATVRVERSVHISASPGHIFETLTTLESFPAWSPWHQADATIAYRAQGPKQGVGASLHWSSESIGEGSVRVVQATPGQTVELAASWDGQAPVSMRFQLQPTEQTTQVYWAIDHAYGWNLFARYIGLWQNDRAGPDLERGLIKLKAWVEANPAGSPPIANEAPEPTVKGDPALRPSTPNIEIKIMPVEPIPIAFASGQSSAQPDALAEALGAAYQQVATHLVRHGVALGSPPVAIRRDISREGDNRFEAGLPIGDADVPESETVKLGTTPGGLAVRATHVGPYADLATTYRAVRDFVARQGYQLRGPAWEVYIDDPARVAERDLRTHVFFSITTAED